MTMSLTLSLKQAVFAGVVAVAIVLAPRASTHAHHGGGVEYFMDRTLGPVSGTVTSFAFSFPHPQIYFDVKDDAGAVQKWAAVLQLTPTGLRARGWSRDSIKPGDMVSVTYSPHRTAANVGFARRIVVNGKFLDEGV